MVEGGHFVVWFGSNYRGQCGQGVGSVEVGMGVVWFPVRVSVEQVVCGGRHCLALSCGGHRGAGQRVIRVCVCVCLPCDYNYNCRLMRLYI